MLPFTQTIYTYKINALQLTENNNIIKMLSYNK